MNGREPRRVARLNIDQGHHLALLDGDVDDLHAHRAQDAKVHEEKHVNELRELTNRAEIHQEQHAREARERDTRFQNVEKKLDSLIRLAAAATCAGFTAGASLIGNLVFRAFS